MEIIGFTLSIVMGLILGLLGGGGSILTVPILVYFFGVPATLATGYSLVIVGTTSLAGALRYRKDQLLDINVAILFSIPAIVGVLISRLWILPLIPKKIVVMNRILPKDQLILYVFSLLIIVISIFMFKSKDAEDHLSEESQSNTDFPYTLIGIEGLLVGIVTGFVGAGGGFMIVPALTLLANIPLRKAIATSLLIISAKSIIGFFGDISEGVSFNFPLLFSILILTLIGTAIGTKLNKRLSVIKLRRGFAYFVLLMGIVIFIKEINTSYSERGVQMKTTIETIHQRGSISVVDFIALKESGQSYSLIDVRQLDEHQESSIEGAVLMPLDTLESNIDTLDKTQTIVLHCRSGKRSSKAQKILIKKGFTKALNLEGGIIAWKNHLNKE